MLQGNQTDTFKEMYEATASAGFCTWRGINVVESNFATPLTLTLYGKVNGQWQPNGWVVTAGWLENAYASPSELASVNARINPLGAQTSLNTLRGLSTYLYQYLLNQGAGYNGDLYYR